MSHRTQTAAAQRAPSRHAVQRIRTRIEEVFGWTKTVADQRKTQFRRAYCPAFESYKASTGGQTREEALAQADFSTCCYTKSLKV
jgi:hypothetical protein